eukprot:scaffold12003_cov44-Attheya_sp.AAC.2
MAWAAAATPVSSMVCVTRVTAKNVKFNATLRSCRAAPPFNNGFNVCHDGNFNSLDHRINFRFNMKYMNKNAENTSAPTVASAAPETPIPIVNINIGSTMAFNKLAEALIFMGVTVSKTPAHDSNDIYEAIEPRITR